MAADRICAAGESYMGLVEVGVGLLPAGGGCRELLRRVVTPAMKRADSDPLPFLGKVFENIAMAKVSASALQAQEMGFLTDCDRIVMKGEHVLAEANGRSWLWPRPGMPHRRGPSPSMPWVSAALPPCP